MTIRYCVSDSHVAPEPVLCHEVGYPHLDVKGRTQYGNSHYDQPADAWAFLLRSSEAGISLCASALEQVETELLRLRERGAAEVKRSAKISEGFEAWKRSIEDNTQGDGAGGTPLEGAAQPGGGAG